MARSTYDINKHRRRKRHNWLFEILILVFAVLLIICANAGGIDPRSFFAGPFLTLAYIPMLLLLVVLLLISLLCQRWVAVITLIVAFVATLPVFKLYMPMNSPDDAPPTPADTTLQLKVMTYNVLSFNYNEAYRVPNESQSMRLILDENPDVVLLQEGGNVGMDWSEIPSIQSFVAQTKARYPYTYNSPEGLNIFSKYPFTTQPLSEPRYTRSILGYNRDNKAYLARAYDLKLPTGKEVRLIDFRLQSYHLSFGKNRNVRVSPDVKPSALERMRRSFILRDDDAATIRKAIDDSPANLIVCGDMNDVPSSHVYWVIRGEDMTDAWSEVGWGYAYTYNRHHLPYRIDHILYRGELQALTAKRIKGGSSDHYPLMVTFDIDIDKSRNK